MLSCVDTNNSTPAQKEVTRKESGDEFKVFLKRLKRKEHKKLNPDDLFKKCFSPMNAPPVFRALTPQSFHERQSRA